MNEPALQLGKALVFVGVLLAGLGFVLILGSRFSFLGLGKLPGDITYKGKNVSFYFPIVKCLLLSGLVTLILWLFSYLSRK